MLENLVRKEKKEIKTGKNTRSAREVKTEKNTRSARISKDREKEVKTGKKR